MMVVLMTKIFRALIILESQLHKQNVEFISWTMGHFLDCFEFHDGYVRPPLSQQWHTSWHVLSFHDG